jgi:integrase
MGLYKRDLVWWMSFTHNGKQLRRSTETEDKKLAIRIFDKLKGEIAEGKWFEKLPGEDYTFGELMDKYMVEYSAVNKAASSHKRDKSLAAHLIKVFGNDYLLDIKPAMVSDYKVQRRDESASPRTINYELNLMSHAFNIAIREWEWIENNPVIKVKKERVRNTIERWLTLDEERNLLFTSPKWLQEIIVFAINTGFRRSEILDLKWSQIDFDRRTIIISEQKNRCVDTLPLNKKAMVALRERQKQRLPGCDLVFPSNNGSRMINRNLFRAFNSAAGRANVIKFRFHDLRHTFATRLVQAGVGIYEVQKLGRWKNNSMVMRYAHHNSESLRSSIEVMDGFKEEFITILSQSPKNKGSQAPLRLVTP